MARARVYRADWVLGVKPATVFSWVKKPARPGA